MTAVGTPNNDLEETSWLHPRQALFVRAIQVVSHDIRTEAGRFDLVLGTCNERMPHWMINPGTRSSLFVQDSPSYLNNCSPFLNDGDGFQRKQLKSLSMIPIIAIQNRYPSMGQCESSMGDVSRW